MVRYTGPHIHEGYQVLDGTKGIISARGEKNAAIVWANSPGLNQFGNVNEFIEGGISFSPHVIFNPSEFKLNIPNTINFQEIYEEFFPIADGPYR
jgi:hypothetical protein